MYIGALDVSPNKPRKVNLRNLPKGLNSSFWMAAPGGGIPTEVYCWEIVYTSQCSNREPNSCHDYIYPFHAPESLNPSFSICRGSWRGNRG